MRGIGRNEEFYGVLIHNKLSKGSGKDGSREIHYYVHSELLTDWRSESIKLPSRSELIRKSIRRKQEVEKSLHKSLLYIVLGLSISFYIARLFM